VSAIASAPRAFCSTRMIVIPLSLLSRTTMSMTWTITLGARPSDGSSSSRIRGRASSARAITSICRSPPDSVAASLRRRSARGRNRSYASARLAARSFLAVRRLIMPMRRFSSTVSSAMTPWPSGTCATPPRAMSSGPCPVMSASWILIRPRRGLTRPLIVRSSVVLPAPLAPSTAVIVAVPALIVTSSSAVTPP
jgi:hypothetical protein